MKTVFALALKRSLSQRITILLMFALPVVFVVLPQPQGMEAPVLTYGLFGLLLLFVAFLLAKQTIEDRQMRTIVRIAAAPIRHRDYLLGHLLAYMSLLAVQVSAFWALTWVLLDGPLSFFLWGYPLLLSFAVMAVSLSLFWHSLFKTYATSIAVYSVAANLMAVMGGMSFPLMYLPDRLRSVAVVLPTYWFAYGLELATDKEHLLVFLCLSILCGFAIIFLAIGSRRRFE